MIEALAVVRFIRKLVADDELLSVEIPGGVVAFTEDDGEDDESCGPIGSSGKPGLPRVVSLTLMSGPDVNSLGPDRAFSDQMWAVKVYGQSGERFADIKEITNRLDLLLQGASQADTDPRFTVERSQTLMDRETDGPNKYPYLGGIYRFLITPEEMHPATAMDGGG